MKVLVLAPHPDDEAIGCGGTLCKHARQGDRVVVVFLTSGELGLKQVPKEQAWQVREAEATKAAAVLGVSAAEYLRLPDWTLKGHLKKAARLLRAILERERPEVVYLPHPHEWHPDHRAVWPLLRAALRAGGISVPELRGYEVWTPLSEHDHVENITAEMPHKLRAIRAYRSQLKDFNYHRAVVGLNQFRGELAGKCRFAEVFSILRYDR